MFAALHKNAKCLIFDNSLSIVAPISYSVINNPDEALNKEVPGNGKRSNGRKFPIAGAASKSKQKSLGAAP